MFRRLLIYSQLLLFGGVAVCITLIPKGLSSNNGISYYGTHIITFSPYITAIIGSSLLGLIATSKYVASSSLNYVKPIMTTIFLLSIGIVLTPYIINPLIGDAHELLGAILFTLQLFLSFKIAMTVRKDFINIFLLLLELSGGIISAVYLLPSRGFLIQGELLFQLAFGLIMIRSAIDLSKTNTN